MATYVSKKCPNCDRYFQVMKSETKAYGSPLRTCSICGGSYLDSDYRELAVEGVRFSDKHFFGSFYYDLALLIIVALLYNGINDFYDWFGVVVPLILTIILLAGRAFYMHRMKQIIKDEMQNSISRLSNQKYAILLLNAGYKVPQKYLNK